MSVMELSKAGLALQHRDAFVKVAAVVRLTAANAMPALEEVRTSTVMLNFG